MTKDERVEKLEKEEKDSKDIELCIKNLKDGIVACKEWFIVSPEQINDDEVVADITESQQKFENELDALERLKLDYPKFCKIIENEIEPTLKSFFSRYANLESRKLKLSPLQNDYIEYSYSIRRINNESLFPDFAVLSIMLYSDTEPSHVYVSCSRYSGGKKDSGNNMKVYYSAGCSLDSLNKRFMVEIMDKLNIF